MAPQTRAALIAYEDFNYTPGETIVGKAGGIGWLNAWQTNGSGANSLMITLPDSMGYTDINGSSLVTSGGSLFLSGATNANNTAQPNRDLLTARTAGTTWISYVGDRQGIQGTNVSNPYTRGANVAFFNTGSERFAAGNPSLAPTNTWAFVPANVAAQRRGSDVPYTDQSFIVLRIDHQGDATAPDNVYMWINPVFGLEPSLGSATITLLAADAGAADYGFNRVRPFAGGNNNTQTQPYAQLQIDELRIGESWGDVTPFTAVPEPSTLALAGLGLLGLWAYRSRSR